MHTCGVIGKVLVFFFFSPCDWNKGSEVADLTCICIYSEEAQHTYTRDVDSCKKKREREEEFFHAR